jgi:hypothetical protein
MAEIFHYYNEDIKKNQTMKTKCKKDDHKIPKNPRYECSKCDRKSKKKEKLCNPKKLLYTEL